MNKEQFGYKLGSLYLKLPVLAKQKAAQYNLPVPLVYVLAYTPVAVLALFSIMLFAAITAILIVLIFLACLSIKKEMNLVITMREAIMKRLNILLIAMKIKH